MSSFRGEDSLGHWLDRHHLDVIRTMVTTLDGSGLGSHIHRHTFVKSLPDGCHIRELAQSTEHGVADKNWPELLLRPDLTTLIQDRHNPNLGHCIAEYASEDGTPISFCPRTTLRKIVEQLEAQHYQAQVAFELAFCLFDSPYDQIRGDSYQNLAPVSGLTKTHSIRRAYHIRDFMGEVTERMGYLGVEFESWNNLANGQVQLNLLPGDPLVSADCVIRTKEVLYKVAVDYSLAATFMTTPTSDYNGAIHIRHTLTSDQTPPEHARSFWIGGLVQELNATMSFLRPTANDYRRGPTVTSTWGTDTNCAIRSLNDDDINIEHRVSASDINPYLALSVILASGISGLVNQTKTPPIQQPLILPATLTDAVENLEQDSYLSKIIGRYTVAHWVANRHKEAMEFQQHTEDDDVISRWELDRYFEII
ncbi:MAG TPA: hypothetical protein DCM54_02750 [Gammaproteobacteria bacterium]|nr:hypothetical protein [Gammaproteobacteria bacterium]